MRFVGIEKIECSNCGHIHDVPIYDNNGFKKYGMKFCHQCGTSLFYKSRTYTLSKNFIDWLTNQYYMLYCHKHECKKNFHCKEYCPFHSGFNGFKKQCCDLDGDERLSVIKSIQDKKETIAKQKFDYSKNCDFDDDSGKNDCWHCIHFLFPIGCMYGEEQEEQKDKELEIKIPCKTCYNPHCEQCKYGYKTEEQIKEMIKGRKK